MKKFIFAVLAVASLITAGAAWAAGGVTVLDRCIVGSSGSRCGAEYARLYAIIDMGQCADVLRQIAGLLDAEKRAVEAARPEDSRTGQDLSPGTPGGRVLKRYSDLTSAAMARAIGRVLNAHECRDLNGLMPN